MAAAQAMRAAAMMMKFIDLVSPPALVCKFLKKLSSAATVSGQQQSE
jgi:hypothetical protein